MAHKKAEPKPRKPKVPKRVYPTCVRHSGAAKDAKLQYFFLGNECERLWSADAFSGNTSLWNGESVHGYRPVSFSAFSPTPKMDYQLGVFEVTSESGQLLSNRPRSNAVRQSASAGGIVRRVDSAS